MQLDSLQVVRRRLGGEFEADVNVLSVVEPMQAQAIDPAEAREFAARVMSLSRETFERSVPVTGPPCVPLPVPRVW